MNAMNTSLYDNLLNRLKQKVVYEINNIGSGELRTAKAALISAYRLTRDSTRLTDLSPAANNRMPGGYKDFGSET